MNRIYVTGGGETVPSLLSAYYGADVQCSDGQELLLAANPLITDSRVFEPGRLVFLPESHADLVSSDESGHLEATWRSLDPSAQQVVLDALRRNEPGFMEALTDLLVTYDVLDNAGNVNTFVGAGFGGTNNRATQLQAAMKDVDSVLREYAHARGPARGALKPRVRMAYERLNNSFGADLKAASLNTSPQMRKAIESPRRGMQFALQRGLRGSRTPILGSSAQALRIMRVARYGKMLGQAGLVFDLGTLAYNTTTSDQPVRTAVSGAAGIAASGFLGSKVYLGCLPVAAAFTGPWSLGLCLLPAGGAALAADWLAKEGVEGAYDLASRLMTK